MIGMGWDEFKSIREENAMRGRRGLNFYYDNHYKETGLEDYNSEIYVPVYGGCLGTTSNWGVELTGVHKERTRIMLELNASVDGMTIRTRNRTKGGIEDVQRDIIRRLALSYMPVPYGSLYDDTVYGMRDRVLEGLRLRSFSDPLFGGGALR